MEPQKSITLRKMVKEMKQVYQFWMTNQLFVYALLTMAGIGVVARLLLWGHYVRNVVGIQKISYGEMPSEQSVKPKLLKRMLRDVDNVNNIDNQNVDNVDNFVDKLDYYDKVGGLSVFFLGKLCRIMLITCGSLLVTVGICGYLYQEDIDKLLTIFLWGLLSITSMMLAEQIFNIKHHRQFLLGKIHSYYRTYQQICQMDRLVKERIEEEVSKSRQMQKQMDKHYEKKTGSQKLESQQKQNQQGQSQRIQNQQVQKQQIQNQRLHNKELINQPPKSLPEQSQVDEMKIISDALHEQVKDLIQENSGTKSVDLYSENCTKRLQLEDVQERALKSSSAEMGDTWNLEDVLAATKERIRKERNRTSQDQTGMETEQKPEPARNPENILRPEDEKVIMDILREYI